MLGVQIGLQSPGTSRINTEQVYKTKGKLMNYCYGY